MESIAKYFIIPISGPINGATYMSRLISTEFRNKVIIINSAQAMSPNDHGRICLKKILTAIELIGSVLKIRNRSLVYLNFTPHGYAYVRDLLLILILKYKKCNVTIHLHANGLEKSSALFNKIIFDNIKIITINEWQKRQLKYINNVYALENRLPCKYEVDINQIIETRTEKKLLFASNISRQKGIFRAIDIYNNIKTRIEGVKLIICGAILEDNIADEFYNIVNSDANIIYMGFVEDKQKHEILSTASALLFLSEEYSETFGLVNLEALMYGLPIITTRQYCSSKFVSSNNGIEIENIDIQKAVYFLEAILTDRNMYRKICRNSYELFKHEFQFKEYINKLNEIIEYRIL